MHSGLVSRNHQQTGVQLPPIGLRSKITTDTSARCRVAGNLAQSRAAAGRAAADAEFNLITSYHRENYSKLSLQIAIIVNLI